MDTESAVERYGTMVYRLAYAQLRSRQDADDVFQEVFLRYHRAAPPFESEEHRKAWLLRVTANRANSLAVSPWRKRSVPLEDVHSYSQPEESGLDAALAQLPPKYRAAVYLHYYEGYSVREVAGAMNANPSTVQTWLMRARGQLKTNLKEAESP